PVAALRRDAFVIRQYSPPLTIGGGIDLETHAEPHRIRDEAVLQQLASLEKENPVERLLQSLLNHADQIASRQNLKHWSGLSDADLSSSLDRLLADQAVYATRSAETTGYIAAQVLNSIKTKIVQSLTAFHEEEPLRPGMNKAELKIAGRAASPKIFEWALKELAAEGKIEEKPSWVRLRGFHIHLNAADEQTARAILAELTTQPFSPPDEKELAERIKRPVSEVRRILGALQGMDRVLHLEGDLYFVREAVTEIEKRLTAYAEHHTEISVSQFRELLATSRKYAVPLLGYFDQQGLTERSGDLRLIHPKAASTQTESSG
ncbi:MAG TPA: SelB C-terminal domain-containing protein, partial [bacterium]|nr:SelB C-terminal domain-containing protein [bacterium]